MRLLAIAFLNLIIGLSLSNLHFPHSSYCRICRLQLLARLMPFNEFCKKEFAGQTLDNC